MKFLSMVIPIRFRLEVTLHILSTVYLFHVSIDDGVTIRDS